MPEKFCHDCFLSAADLGGVEDGAGDDGEGGEDAGTSGHAGAAVHIAHLLRSLACHKRVLQLILIRVQSFLAAVGGAVSSTDTCSV